MKYNYPVNMTHITSYSVTLAAPEVIGPLAEGLRLNIYATGGVSVGRVD